MLTKFNERKSAASFCHQVTISPFYELFLCQNPFAKILQTQIVSNEKLRKNLSYKKAAQKIMVKLTPGGSMVSRYVLQLLVSEKSQKLLKTQQPLKVEKKYAHIWSP
jgi:hypothetical protein